MGLMPNSPNYACTRCHTPTSREQLTVKLAMFREMGEGARTVRSRVIDWLCATCLDSDPDFNREKFSPPRVVSQIA